MRKYIGTKLVTAAPAYKNVDTGHVALATEEGVMEDMEGYLAGDMVKYQDGYTSWSPKDVFEAAYLQVDDNKDLPSGVSIGPEMVERLISSTETQTMGDKTTVVRCVLKNGFEIVEASSCVDARNYSEEIGKEICMRRIRNKIWELLGFLLQTAWHGIR